MAAIVLEEALAMNDCIFCDEIKGKGNSNFSKRYPDLNSRVIWRDEFLFAMPCIGQLRPGHFMILPVDHHSTWKQCFHSAEELNERVSLAIKNIRINLPDGDSELFIFEHGARRPTDGGCGIYHAHLHVVPVEAVFDEREVFALPLEKRALNLSEIFEATDTESSYVLSGFWGHGFRYEQLEQPMPSQYLRRKLASWLKVEEWDWRVSGREDAMLSTISAFQTS